MYRSNARHLGGEPGFIAVLHTWTRRILHHPHLHLLVPALGIKNGGCALVNSPNQEYLIPERALAQRVRAPFEAKLKNQYPELAKGIDLSRDSQDWVVQCQQAGRGRSALRYLAAYVAKSAFHETRLTGYDAQGRVLLRYKDSSDRQWKIEPLEPLELIRRWLLHVLPQGLVRVRHYGWLSPAAGKTLRRIRFLLGLGPVRVRGLTTTITHFFHSLAFSLDSKAPGLCLRRSRVAITRQSSPPIHCSPRQNRLSTRLSPGEKAIYLSSYRSPPP